MAKSCVRHQTTLRITIDCVGFSDISVITHTCGASTVAAHCLIGGPNSLGWQGRGRGVGLSPYDDIWGKFQNSASELRYFKGGAEFLATWGAQVG